PPFPAPRRWPTPSRAPPACGCARPPSTAGSSPEKRSGCLSSPLHDRPQDLDRAGGPLHHEVAPLEEVLGRFGRPYPDSHVRDVERTHVLEERAVVLVIAEADDAARVLAGQKCSEGAALARLGRVNLDDLAPERSRQARAVEQRPEQVEHFLATHFGFSKMNRGARGLDLDP